MPTLLAMLRRESELRLSPAVQAAYKQSGYEGYVAVTENVQAQVAEEFGMGAELGSMLLQCAESLTDDENALKLIRETSFYRKFNRMKDGGLAVGMKAPDINADLIELTPSLVETIGFSLSIIGFREIVDMSSTNYRPVVIVASSYS